MFLRYLCTFLMLILPLPASQAGSGAVRSLLDIDGFQNKLGLMEPDNGNMTHSIKYKFGFAQYAYETVKHFDDYYNFFKFYDHKQTKPNKNDYNFFQKGHFELPDNHEQQPKNGRFLNFEYYGYAKKLPTHDHLEAKNQFKPSLVIFRMWHQVNKVLLNMVELRADLLNGIVPDSLYYQTPHKLHGRTGNGTSPSHASPVARSKTENTVKWKAHSSF